MTLGTADRVRLVDLAREQLPVPGDPRLLIEEFTERKLAGPEALAVLARTSLAWTQLRDMGLERTWQSLFGWFLARNLIVFGVVALALYYVLAPPPAVLDGALAGAAIYYLITLALAPLRLRRHKARRAGILAAYGKDLGSYLDELAPSSRG